MAARFPQSASPISGKRIPPSLVAEGVKAVIWAASADSVHVLLAGQTTTTLLTRTPGGATYNSTDGRITGTIVGNGTSQYFALAVVGGIGVVANDYTEIVSYFGDTGTGWPNMWFIGSDTPMGVFGDWEGIFASTFARADYKGAGGIYQIAFSTSGAADYSNASNDFCVFGIRSNQGDATAKHRGWCNGAEDTGLRTTGALADTTALGSSTGRAIYFGGTNAATAGGVGIAEFEAALIGTGAVSAATMDALTAKAGPVSWIEDVPVDTTPPTITGPGGSTGATSSATVNENQTTVHTFTANESVTWDLNGGDDVAKFSISGGGALAFLAAPNREAPTDADVNNTYIVGVRATDGAGNATTQTCTVTVANVNEAPAFAGPTIGAQSGIVGVALTPTGYAARFSDPDSGDTGAYSAAGSWPPGVTVASDGTVSGTPTTQGTYPGCSIRRTDGGGLTADSDTFTWTITPTSSPPTITADPANTAAYVGNTATLSVTATGTAPLTYQWRKGGVNIPGATSSSYTTPTLGLGDNASQFDCVVSNAYGSDTSTVATLTVTVAPAGVPIMLGVTLDGKVVILS